MQADYVSGPESLALASAPDGDPAVVAAIRALISRERFAVLCTQSACQPYDSLVAVAFGGDFRSFLFATPMDTRKYRLLTECDHVALVVDDRGRFPDDISKVSAVTVTGRATEIGPGDDHERLAGLLTGRHPYLRSFVQAPSTALFRVSVVRYLHVTRFQEVHEWILERSG